MANSSSVRGHAWGLDVFQKATLWLRNKFLCSRASLKREYHPPSQPVGGWPELPGERARGAVLRSQPSISPPSLAPSGLLRLVWRPSQAPKHCTGHGLPPDTLPGPGSESQPQSRSAPAWCSWPLWQAVLATLLQGSACPSQTASRIIISLSLFLFVPASAPSFL